MEIIKKALIELLNKMNPLVQSTAKHLSRVTLTQTSLDSVYALHPEVREKVLILMARMQERGMPVYMHQGYRTEAKQNELYDQGRSEPGNIVTYARGLESAHNYGLAADLIFVKHNWSPPYSSWWQELGAEARKLGLVWGGDWDFKDFPHVEHPEFDANRKALLEFFKK